MIVVRCPVFDTHTHTHTHTTRRTHTVTSRRWLGARVCGSLLRYSGSVFVCCFCCSVAPAFWSRQHSPMQASSNEPSLPPLTPLRRWPERWARRRLVAPSMMNCERRLWIRRLLCCHFSVVLDHDTTTCGPPRPLAPRCAAPALQGGVCVCGVCVCAR